MPSKTSVAAIALSTAAVFSSSAGAEQTAPSTSESVMTQPCYPYANTVKQLKEIGATYLTSFRASLDPIGIVEIYNDSANNVIYTFLRDENQTFACYPTKGEIIAQSEPSTTEKEPSLSQAEPKTPEKKSPQDLAQKEPETNSYDSINRYTPPAFTVKYPPHFSNI